MNSTFGKYELLERIGRGGMAEVYLARSTGAEGLYKKLVIKKILPRYASSDRFVEMFIQEAKVAMRLNHPNIVQVYDFGRVGEDYFLAMEYVEGVELGDLLRASGRSGQPVSVGDAVYVGVEVARGLDYIHRRADSSRRRQQLIHRDISPENLMVSRDGAVKIVDFGIATETRDVAEGGQMRGKYRYMSPEEARGDPVDARSDLFSLGVVLFEMLCRRQLFRGDTPREILDLVESAVVPDIGSINPEVPARLEHAIYRVLSSRPDQRFDTARDLQVELTRVLHDLPEIHDAATLAQHLKGLDHQLGAGTGGVTPLERSETSQGRQTVPAVETGQQQVPTPPAPGDSSPRSRPSRVVKQRKPVVVVAGRLEQNAGSFGAEYRHIIESIAYKNDAVVERVDDDEFVLLMGIPISEETDAERAARMAFQIEDALAEQSRGDAASNCRVAVSSGEVIFEESIADASRDYDWSLQSEASRRIVRLLERGGGGEIVAGEEMYRRVRRAFSCTRLSGHGPAGQTEEEVGCYRLEGEKSPSTRIRELRRSFQAFYGREIPHRRLMDNLRQCVIERRARALVLLGPAGVGKSTLIEQFLEGLQPRDVRVVRGIASPLHRDVPLKSAAALFAEMLDLDPEAPREVITELLEHQIDELFANASCREREWLVDSLSQMFTAGGEGSGQAEGRRRHLFAAIRRLVNRLAQADRPLVVAIDDIHNVDPVMMAFAAEYFDRSQRVPVFFVGTGRQAGPHVQTHPWKALREAGNVAFEHLGELPESEARRMVRELLEVHGVGPESRQGLVDTVVEQAGGNPLYIREVVSTLADRQAMDEEGAEVGTETARQLLPPSLEGVIRARVDRLPVEHREVLKQVSVLPMPFSARRARAVCQREVGEVLDRLVDAGLLVKDSGEESANRIRFTDAVTRKVAARALTDQQARELHGRVAQLLMDQPGEADAAVVARHLDRSGQHEQALQMYEEAAREAFDQFGADQCLRLCARILDHPNAGEKRRFRALLWRHRALKRLGQQVEALEALERLEELTGEVATPRQRCEVALRRGWLHVERGNYDSAREVASEARAVADEHDEPLAAADSWRLEAIIDLNEGDRDRALALIDRAIASLNVGDDPRARRTMVEAYNARGIILRQSGRHREALQAYETALAGAEQLGSTTLRRQLLLNTGLAKVYVGEFSAAKRRYDQSLEMCRRLGYRRDEALVLVNLGHLYQILGRVRRAKRCVRRGIALARRTDSPKTVADGEITLGMVLLEEEELQAAATRLRDGYERAESLPNTYLMVCARLGLCDVDLRRDEETAWRRAVERARETLERCRQAGMMWGVAVAREVIARGLSRLGEHEEAMDHSRRALELLEEVELLGVDQILCTHAGLLEGSPGADAERRECIERAHEIYQARLDAIDDEQDRQAFAARRSNQKIRWLASELDREHQPAGSPTE